MRLIDANALLLNILEISEDSVRELVRSYIRTQPTVDAVSLIRCKDCKHCRTYYHGINEKIPFSYACDRLYLTSDLSDDDYCSRAERKEE